MFIHVPWFGRMVVKLCRHFMDDFQNQVNQFFGSDYKSAMDELFGLENIEQQYGGEVPDKTNAPFFPPEYTLA